jgi:hypothetical protein
MTTVTGTISDALGNPLCVWASFQSRSTPTFATGGEIVANTTKRLRTNLDGTFSVVLDPGRYTVTYQTSPQTTAFDIYVPTGTGTATIDTLLTAQYTLPGSGGISIPCPGNSTVYVASIVLVNGIPTISLALQ